LMKIFALYPMKFIASIFAGVGSGPVHSPD